MAHKRIPDPVLMTADLARELHVPGLYSQEDVEDPIARAKFFTPDGSWTWYVLEWDEADRLFFGLVDGHEAELGYFSQQELEQLRGRLGLPVERDLHFRGRLLSEVRREIDARRSA